MLQQGKVKEALVKVLAVVEAMVEDEKRPPWFIQRWDLAETVVDRAMDDLFAANVLEKPELDFLVKVSRILRNEHFSAAGSGYSNLPLKLREALRKEFDRFAQSLGDDVTQHFMVHWNLAPAGMEEVTASWAKADATPQREEIQKPFLPIFYDLATFHLLPLVGKKKMFIVVVSPDEKDWVEDLLTFNRVPEANYRIIVSKDPVEGIREAQDQYAHQYRVHLVDKGRKRWSDELFAGLEEDGVIPVGDWQSALEITERYISRFM